jgi:type I restriction enzyme, S subunit
MIDRKNLFPEARIESLANPEPGSFKIGPFGSSLKKDELVHQGIPVVGIENVLPNKMLVSFRKFITEEKFAQLSQYLIRPDDILVTTMGTIGRAAVVPDGIGRAIIDSHLFRMRVDPSKVDPAYLCYGLNGYRGIQQELVQKASGAIMAGLNTQILKACTIPLPPLPEQKRIAAILNERMTAIEQARIAAEEQLKAAKALPAAYLRTVFNSPEAQQWSWKGVGELLVEPLKTGISKPLLPHADKHCLTLSAVRNGLLDLTASKPVDVSDLEAKGNWVRSNTFYVVRGNGNRSLVGRGAQAPSMITTPVLYPDLLIQVVTDPRFICGDFLRIVWDNHVTRTDIETRARTSAGIYKINQAHLAEVKLPIPSLVEQQRIVAHLTERMAAVKRLRVTLDAEIDAINTLPPILLRHAFHGDL